jgi:CheY-like chemotaxis protein
VRTILVVEDNPIDVMLLERTFRQLELWDRVHVVNDGLAAIQYLSGEAQFSDRATFPLPYVIVLDLKLPKRSGFEVLSWIRSNSSLQHLPVVIFTSSKDSEDVTKAYQAGANSYISKTPDQDELGRIAGVLHDYWVTHNIRAF